MTICKLPNKSVFILVLLFLFRFKYAYEAIQVRIGKLYVIARRFEYCRCVEKNEDKHGTYKL